MEPYIGIACTGEIARSLQKVINSMHLPARFVFSDALLRDEQTLPPELENADVLMASGYLIKVLRRITNKPIVQMKPSLIDVVSCYSEVLRENPHERPVIILPEESSLYHIDIIENIGHLHMNVIYYKSLSQIPKILENCRHAEYTCVVGSGLVCEKANMAGFRSRFVYPQEALRNYVNIALETAVSINRSMETTQQLQSIIRYSAQGIIFTDSDGTINVANANACRQLSTDMNKLLGKKCARFFREQDTDAVFLQSEPVNHRMYTFGDTPCIISFFPIVSEGKLRNVMITIDDVQHIQSQSQHIRKALAKSGHVARWHFHDFTTQNKLFREVLEKAKKYALSDEYILVQGETGTGKEGLVQSIHNYSRRSNQSFVAVNCSAISESLLESELFGYEEGAFTGARKGGKEGYFEQADGGTIFLDEISEMSLPLQSKLLRAIQEKELIRVGGNSVIRVDARVITATNRNLWQLVKENRFREDLYYRLSVLELDLPPLKDRPEDVVSLFLSFVRQHGAIFAADLRYHVDELQDILGLYSWPGNIRELENFTKAIIVAWDDTIYTEGFLRFLKRELDRRMARGLPQNNHDVSPLAAFDTPHDHVLSRPVRRAESLSEIEHALTVCEGSMAKAAAYLGISRTTLWRRLRALGFSSAASVSSLHL